MADFFKVIRYDFRVFTCPISASFITIVALRLSEENPPVEGTWALLVNGAVRNGDHLRL